MKQNSLQKPTDQTTTAGRGWLSITLSKIYFIIAGYAVALTLPRLLGTPEAFGLYSATLSVISIINNVLNVATVQTVSKKVSENLQKADHILNQGLRIQFTIGCLLSLTLILGADFIARDLLLDAQMAPLFRVVSVVIFSNALYATLVGSLNGRHMFQRQAALDMTYSTLRSTGILGAAAMGFGVVGALSGYSGAVVLLLLISLAIVGIGKAASKLPLGQWFSFMAPLWIYHLCLNLIMLVDLMVLKRTVADIALQTLSVQPFQAAELASKYAGFYRAAQTFAFVPYQLLIPVTFIVFPMISKAVSREDSEATRKTIREALRFSFLAALAMTTPISGAASGVMRLAYPETYLAGSGALSILSLGMTCFALFVISATILSSAGYPMFSAVIGTVSLCLVIGGNLTLIHIAGVGKFTLQATATGTSIGTGFAFVVTGIFIYRRFGVFIEYLTLIRGSMAGAFGYWVAHFLPDHNRLFSLIALIAGGLAYLTALILLREIRSSDFEMVRKMMKK